MADRDLDVAFPVAIAAMEVSRRPTLRVNLRRECGDCGGRGEWMPGKRVSGEPVRDTTE